LERAGYFPACAARRAKLKIRKAEWIAEQERRGWRKER
jgi:hypothetical protein